MDLADLFGDYLPEPLEDSHSVEDVLVVDDLPQDHIIPPLAVPSGEAPEQATKEAELGETGESSRGAGSRKRGRASAPTLHFKTPSKKKKEEEDVCFICFDGGDLVCCKRRGCPKVYHPACVELDKGLMQSKSEWNCSWHMCNICAKASQYACYTCAYSLCKGCMKEADFLCIRGNKGFCGSCFQTVLQIEQNVQTNKGMTEVDVNDKIRWEYLFKQYWLDLKGKLSLTLEELNRARNSLKGSGKSSNKEPFDGQFDANGDQCTSSDSFSENTKAGNSKTGKGKNQASTSTGKGGKNQASTSTGKGGKNQASTSTGKGGKNQASTSTGKGGKSQASASTGKGGKNQASTSTGKGVSSATSDGTEWDADDFPEFDESASAKTDSRKKRKSRRRIEEKGASKRRVEDRRPQVNPNDYAAIDMHNINLIYLRRNLMEDLLVDLEKFHDTVVGSYVRIRTSGMDQMPDMHRLVQVVGTGKAVEAYQSGRMMTDFVLEILNLDKTEFISIDTISNQGFTEEECRSLHQGIKSGLTSRLKVGEIQKKAMSLQEVRVKDWLETETSRLCNVRDRANEKGRRKELRECLKQLELLSSPDERARRFDDIPDIHVDPKMDPKYDSIEEGNPDNTKQDNCMKPKAVELSIKGKDTISPGEGDFASSCDWNMASSSVAQEIISTPPSTETAAPSEISETDKIWHYQDRSSKIQGPFSMTQLRKWSKHFPTSLRIWKTSEQQEDSKLLTDVLGEFQEPLSWDKSADGWDTQASKSEIPTDGGWTSKPTTTPSGWGDAGASAAVGNSSDKQDPSGNWKPLTSSNSWATMLSTDTSVPSNTCWGTGAATENPNTDWGIASQGNAGTEWGAASAPAKEGNAGNGWGAASAAAQGENAGPGWGAASAASKEGNVGSGWGAASAPAKEGNAGSGWGAASAAAQGESAGTGWGAASAAAQGESAGTGWGATSAAAKEGNVGSGWGATSAPAKEGNAGSGWGAASAAAQGEKAGTGWGAASAAAKEGNAGSGWGASQKSADGGWKASTWENVNKGLEASAGNSSTWGATQGNANAGWKTGTWDTSGGNSSGGHGGGGPGSCYKCGEQGHMAKDCPKGGGGGSGSCYKCGEPGHMARDCPKGASGGGGGSCFKCGETGHMARDCPKGGSGGGSGSCYKCGEAGHMARDCPKGGSGVGGSCYKCGESGHMARDCPKGGSGGGGSCYKCGESGHMARDCPKGSSGGGGSCYKCGESGHMARDCPKGGSGGGGSCYKCGESGHMARDCPKGGSGGGGSCYKCGESGHMARDCPKGSSGGGGGSCYKCGESGHMARDCPKVGSGGSGGSCYKCGGSGHMARECPQGGGGGGGGSCYKCGEAGHMARECPRGGGGGGSSCYKCGEAGHMARECPQGGGGGGGGSCYKCGEAGHMARECPQGGGGGGGSCYKCGEQGHFVRECPNST